MRSILSILIGLVLCGSACADITTGLVSHWTMNDNAASTTILAATGSNATLQGGKTTAGITTSSKGGTLATALSFDGTSDYATASNVIGTNNFTVAAWVRRSGGTGVRVMLAGTPARWNLQLKTTNLLTFSVGGVADLNSSISIADATWTHIAVVFNGSNQALFYIDGSFAQQINAASPAGGSTSGINMAAYDGALFKFPGALDDVRTYSRSLSAGDVTELYALSADALTKYIRLRGIGGKLQTINGSPVGVSQ